MTPKKMLCVKLAFAALLFIAIDAVVLISGHVFGAAIFGTLYGAVIYTHWRTYNCWWLRPTNVKCYKTEDGHNAFDISFKK